jgi:hypothetical protein
LYFASNFVLAKTAQVSGLVCVNPVRDAKRKIMRASVLFISNIFGLKIINFK